MDDNKKQSQHTSVTTSLIAGSIAGISTDIILYPIDTIKTRLQSRDGFLKSGGFRSVYRGLGSTALGSAPSGASFFLAYEFSKKHTSSYIKSDTIQYAVSACIGETFSCCFRIPFEVVKQNAQAFQHLNSRSAFVQIYSNEGVRGFYRGFLSMLFREVPFALLQMPIWEFLKKRVSKYNNGHTSALHSGMCGSIAGGITAALTTPLDVTKTRIILAQNSGSNMNNPFKVLYQIALHEGLARLFAGVVPRVIWISSGGFVFLGAYDQAKIIFQRYE